METVKPKPIEFKKVEEDDQTYYIWTKGGEELARIVAKEAKSFNPKIEFTIKESLIPYYEDDKKSALDEIGEMSMFANLQKSLEDGFIHGSLRCSHNAGLGIGSFVQSVKGWVNKN